MKKTILVLLISLLFSLFNQTNAQILLGEKITDNESNFSYSASLSTSFDGSRVAVGGYGKSQYGFRVYDFNGVTWNQTGSDIETEYPNSISYYQVDLSADGNRIVTSTIVGTLGFIKVYEFLDSNWIQIGSTLFGETNSDLFGLVVVISANGQRIAAGAKFNNNSIGHARVFEYDGDDWNQLGIDIDGDDGGFYFGTSISLSADGNRLAVGANQYFPGGLVRIFEFEGSQWNQIGSDLRSLVDNDNFGVSTSLSHDGNRIIIGATQTLLHSGYCKVYDFDGTNWIQVGNIISGDAIQNQFGSSVSISDDGYRIVVGAPSTDSMINTNQSGYSKIFELNNGIWEQKGITLNGEQVKEKFGSRLAISGDGNRLIAGALSYVYLESGTENGYAKVYDLNTLLGSSNLEHDKTFSLYPNPSQTTLYFTNAELINDINIFNMLNQKINLNRKTQNSIDVSNLSNGIYSIQLITNKQQIINQYFIKE